MWGAHSDGFRALMSEDFGLKVSRGLFAIVLLLAWRFRRGRVVLILTALATLMEAPAVSALASKFLAASKSLAPLVRAPLDRAELFEFYACLIAINILWISWVRDWPVVSRVGFARFWVLAAQALAGWLFLHSDKAYVWKNAVTHPWGFELFPWALPISWSVALLFALVVLVLSWRAARPGSTPLDFAWLGTVVALCLALLQGGHWRYFLTWGALLLGLMMIEQVFSLAFEDGLTGLPARRALEEALPYLGRKYSIAMVDIDHFKKINDRYGHDVGDQVLKLIGAQLARVQGGGRSYRYGGEEFCVLFPGRSAKESGVHLEALRKAIEGRAFAVRSSERPKRRPKKAGGRSRREPSLKVTVSIGLAQKSTECKDPGEVMKAADKALYRAKRGGRNRLILAR